MYKAHLFQIGPLLNGAMIYATDGSGPITFGGNVYQPPSSGFGAWSRDSVTVKIGLDSNSCRLTVFADARVPVYFPGTSNAALLLDGIKHGLLGQAPVTIYCAYMPSYGQVAATASPFGSYVETKFVGQVANVEYIGMTKATIVVQDMLYLLNVQVPRMILQASCSNVLFDTKCTLSAGAFSRTNSIGAVTNAYTFAPASALSTISASGTFSQGTLTFTGGQNNGLSYFVRLWTPGSPGSIQLDVAPIFPLHATDAFIVTEGCNKTFASCLNLQGSTNSLLNFSGQPNTPVPETAL
jgi:hypothetical protein